MRSFSIVVAAAAAALSASLAAAAPPARIPVQAFLTSRNGTPITGARTVKLELWTKDTGGTSLHSETLDAVQVNRGHLVVHLGDGAVLDLGLFAANAEVYLQVTVGEEEIQPRFRLASLPWAGHAAAGGSAQTLGGLAPSAFAAAGHSVSWAQLSDKPAGWTDGDNDLARSLACRNGETPKSKGPNQGWTCGADTNTTYTASSGLALNGATFHIPAKGVGSAKMAHGISYNSNLTVTAANQSTTRAPLTVADTANARFDGDEIDFDTGLGLQCSGQNIVLGESNGIRDSATGGSGRPVRMSYHQLPAGTTTLATSYSAATYYCIVGGFAFYNGDFNEWSGGAANLLEVYTRVNASSGNWEIVASIKHHNSPEPSADVALVCISLKLAEYASWFT